MPTADSGSLVRGQRDPGGQSEQRVTEHRGTAGSNDRRKLTRQPRLLLVVLIGSQRIDTGGLDVGQPLLDGCAQLGTGPDSGVGEQADEGLAVALVEGDRERVGEPPWVLFRSLCERRGGVS